jgi:hypothetical protein
VLVTSSSLNPNASDYTPKWSSSDQDYLVPWQLLSQVFGHSDNVSSSIVCAWMMFLSVVLWISKRGGNAPTQQPPS